MKYCYMVITSKTTALGHQILGFSLYTTLNKAKKYARLDWKKSKTEKNLWTVNWRNPKNDYKIEPGFTLSIQKVALT